MGGEDDKTKIYDFIEDTLSENKVPVLIKKDNKIYLFSREDIFRIINENKVYPCYQANNVYYTCVPGEPTGGNPPICPTDPPLPEGITPGMKNVNENIELFSLQSLLNMRILTSFSHFYKSLAYAKKLPICLLLIKTTNTVPSITKLPFVVGVGKLHCNANSEKEVIWDLETIDCKFSKNQLESLKNNYPIFSKIPETPSPPPPSSEENEEPEGFSPIPRENPLRDDSYPEPPRLNRVNGSHDPRGSTS